MQTYDHQLSPTYSRCICVAPEECTSSLHTHTHTHTHIYTHTHTHTHTESQKRPQLCQQIILTASTLQNKVEITYQQKNHVNMIVEILNCKIQQEYSVLPSCTRPGVSKRKLDFLNLF